jgi:hypothetical protein
VHNSAGTISRFASVIRHLKFRGGCQKICSLLHIAVSVTIKPSGGKRAMVLEMYGHSDVRFS